MANSTEEAMPRYALTRDLLILRECFPQLAAKAAQALPLTLELIATRVYPDDIPLFHEKIEQARSAIGEVDFELRLRIPDGSVRYLHVMAHGIRDQASQMEYIGATRPCLIWLVLRPSGSDPPNLDGARAAARRTLRDVERAHDLITHLRMLVGKKEITSDTLDLNDAIREAVALYLPHVRGDRIQLQQVVLNLLANSSHHHRARTSCQ